MSQETIKKLEEQLRETQVAKEELVQQQQELHEMMIRLEESKNLEAEERARLEAQAIAEAIEEQEKLEDREGRAEDLDVAVSDENAIDDAPAILWNKR